MSEKLFRFLASEITFVRVACKKAGCGTVLEIHVDKLANSTNEINCPTCGSSLQKSEPDQHLSNFAAALARLNKVPYIEVSFSLPAE